MRNTSAIESSASRKRRKELLKNKRNKK
jgi:hypothetical protein